MPFIHDEEMDELNRLVNEHIKQSNELVELLKVKDEQIERLATMVRESHKMIRELLEPKRGVEREDY